ncbi:hypothetical protein VTN00DRAFT_1902 [Thermoascus crustaceus]|uniref:uncharacterized protein n=1 Tax=Thermoascus crustaceus TaxID=5088 RepID=UPI003742137A
MDFTNKVYTITGISGIGLAVARHLYSHGAKLSLADIDPQALSDAVVHITSSSSSTPSNPSSSSPSDNIMTTQVDVSNVNQVNAWIAATVARFGRLDGCANMAGAIGKHHGIRKLVDQEDSEWDLIMRVNLTGLMYCMRAQLRAILELKKTQEGGSKGGSIVNAASIQGVRGFAMHAAYSASKHGVVGLTRSVAKEVAGDGVRVNAVAPGTIQTPLLDKSVVIMGGAEPAMPQAIQRLGTADDVAQTVLFLLSDASSYTTGAVYSVDGGWNC